MVYYCYQNIHYNRHQSCNQCSHYNYSQNIEWKSMDWRNCIEIFNDKSKVLLKSSTLSDHGTELSKLELACSKSQTIVNFAFNSLLKYREILHTLKTDLAKIEGSIRQIE
ncbi:unnamed protein product, partial [Schistosoma curassoni]|uniref:Uncharacterized protein n=1 Tax=Schistosoma curassoni TaxID=6186 RepID=A0A183JRN9_9TREM